MSWRQPEVKDTAENYISVTTAEENHSWTFEMPADDVTVTAIASEIYGDSMTYWELPYDDVQETECSFPVDTQYGTTEDGESGMSWSPAASRMQLEISLDNGTNWTPLVTNDVAPDTHNEGNDESTWLIDVEGPDGRTFTSVTVNFAGDPGVGDTTTYHMSVQGTGFETTDEPIINVTFYEVVDAR